MENLTQSWTFFSIFKKGQGRPPPVSSSCTSVNVDWYASISLNIPKSSWKCLNNVLTMSGLWLFLIVLHVWQALKMSRLLNVSEFWIWHGCICKGYIEFWICLNMAQYASILKLLITFFFDYFKWTAGFILKM